MRNMLAHYVPHGLSPFSFLLSPFSFLIPVLFTAIVSLCPSIYNS